MSDPVMDGLLERMADARRLDRLARANLKSAEDVAQSTYKILGEANNAFNEEVNRRIDEKDPIEDAR